MAPSRFVILSALGAALGAGCAGTTDERTPDFSTVVTQILRPGCATAACHDAMSAVARLDFSTVATSSASIDRRSLVPIGGTDDPDGTELINVLTTSGDKRMPVDGPLADADLELIRTWIVDGAVH